MQAEGDFGEIRDEILRAVRNVRLKIRGIASENIEASDKIRDEVMAYLLEDDLKNKNGNAKSETNSSNNEISDTIIEYLSTSIIPVTLDEIMNFLESSGLFVGNKPSFTVRMHRMVNAPASLVISPSRGHFWVNEVERVRRQRHRGGS